jgi:hypothetical protein
MTLVAADLAGNVFRDFNDNGRSDAGADEPLGGVPVYLDLDNDGTPDAGEPQAVSDAAGNYAFPILDPGTYVVRTVSPGLRESTVPPPAAGPTVTITTAVGVRRNFALTTRSRITGVVFNDANANGVRDAGETPIQSSASAVFLDSNNNGFYDPGEVLATVDPANPREGYAITDLGPGTYTVRFLTGLPNTPSEVAQTTPSGSGGHTGYVVTLGPAEVSSGHDFGSYFGNTPVQGFVYDDRNRDGARASVAAEPGLEGRVVYFDFDNDGVLDPDESRAFTLQGGRYLLPTVRGQTYTVRTVLPDGWTQSQPAGGAAYTVTSPPTRTDYNFGTHPIAFSSVVGRSLFYNNSAFSFPSSGFSGNDNAIAPDKQALLPGGQAGAGNVSNYSHGINGLMIDLRGLITKPYPDGGPAISLIHFDVIGPTTSAWVPSTAAARMYVRRGAGVDGSDRIVVALTDDVIRNQWLRVTVLANNDTGLAAPDVFYFGSLVGETGDASSPLRVSAADLAGIKRSLNTQATVASHFDVNHDGQVNALDLGLAKANLNRGLAPLITPVPLPPPAPAAQRDGFLAGLLA